MQILLNLLMKAAEFVQELLDFSPNRVSIIGGLSLTTLLSIAPLFDAIIHLFLPL